MDPLARNGAAIRARIEASIGALVQNFENVLDEATVSGKSTTVHGHHTIAN
jgi:hypothetical protein